MLGDLLRLRFAFGYDEDFLAFLLMIVLGFLLGVLLKRHRKIKKGITVCLVILVLLLELLYHVSKICIKLCDTASEPLSSLSILNIPSYVLSYFITPFTIGLLLSWLIKRTRKAGTV